MTQGYAYEHAWAMERVRLAGLEVPLTRGRASTSPGWAQVPESAALRSAPEADRWLSGSQNAWPRPRRAGSHSR